MNSLRLSALMASITSWSDLRAAFEVVVLVAERIELGLDAREFLERLHVHAAEPRELALELLDLLLRLARETAREQGQRVSCSDWPSVS